MVQNRLDITNKSIILDDGLALTRDSIVIIQDAGRATPLLYGTLMAKIALSGKYTPFISEVAIDGTALPSAIYLGADIPAADLVAGDIADTTHLLGGTVVVDENRIVIEAAKTLDTVIATGTVNAKTVRDAINDRGIFLGASEDSTSFEN